MIFADEQGMGDTFRIQQIDLAVFHEQFRAVTGADALQYKIGFPPDFPEEGCLAALSIGVSFLLLTIK